MIQKHEDIDYDERHICGAIRFNYDDKQGNHIGTSYVYKTNNNKLYFLAGFRPLVWFADCYITEKLGKEELEEVKEIVKKASYGTPSFNKVEYITCEQAKQYFKTHKHRAKEEYAKAILFCRLNEDEEIKSKDHTLSAFLTYGVDNLLEYISNDGIEENYDDEYGSDFDQIYNQEQLELMKQALKIIIGLLDEEQKDEIEIQIININNNLYTDPWGRDCWKNTIDLNELGLGEKE